MKKILAVLLIISCALPVMAKKRSSEEIITPMTQLEKRQFQTHTYSNYDSITLLKAALNVLQDEGFMVYNANSTLGFIYAVKDFDISDSDIDISKEFGLTKSRLKYNGVAVATLEAAINVTEYGDKSRIRINFKRKLLNEYGNAQLIDDVSENDLYADFYEKLDSVLSLREKIQQNEQPVNNTKIKNEPVKPAVEIKEIDSEITNQQTPELKEDNAEINNMNSDIKIPQTESDEDNAYTSEEEQNIQPGQIISESEIQKQEEKELRELLKQAKQEAKQEQKELKQAQKQAKIEAKQQAKELKAQENETDTGIQETEE